MASAPTSYTNIPPRPINLAIIGGGISGLALLIGLLKHTSPTQVRPHIHEANLSFPEIGAGLSFTPNCIQATKLLEPRLFAAYWDAVLPKPTAAAAAAGTPPRKPEMYFVTGVEGRDGKFPCFEHIFELNIEKAGGPGLHRKVFLELLTRLVPGEGEDDVRGQGPYVSFRKKLLAIEELETDAGVDLKFGDGSTVHADAVIGCDGIKGLTRKIVLERNGEPEAVEPKFSGKFCCRGLILLKDPKAKEEISEEIRRNNIFQFAYGAHLFAYPVMNGELLNVVATHKTDDGTWKHGKWVIPASRERLEADMDIWGSPGRAILANMQDPDAWALFEAQRCNIFYRNGKLCLMGDSAHATTPHQGAGVSQCIEDALVLSTLFGIIEREV